MLPSFDPACGVLEACSQLETMAHLGTVPQSTHTPSTHIWLNHTLATPSLTHRIWSRHGELLETLKGPHGAVQALQLWKDGQLCVCTDTGVYRQSWASPMGTLAQGGQEEEAERSLEPALKRARRGPAPSSGASGGAGVGAGAGAGAGRQQSQQPQGGQQQADEEAAHVVINSIACCGLALHHDAQWVASGDLGGKVSLWHIPDAAAPGPGTAHTTCTYDPRVGASMVLQHNLTPSRCVCMHPHETGSARPFDAFHGCRGGSTMSWS